MGSDIYLGFRCLRVTTLLIVTATLNLCGQESGKDWDALHLVVGVTAPKAQEIQHACPSPSMSDKSALLVFHDGKVGIVFRADRFRARTT